MNSIFFTQTRTGLNGKPFKLYKFRTMKPDTNPYANSPTSPNDERITKFGRFLRKYNIDELPQIINILKGEMALVGPRPEMPQITEKYTEKEKIRLTVKPGLTGLWQLYGDKTKHIHENIEYDLYYVKNKSIFLDLKIIAWTILKVPLGKNSF